MRISTDVGCCCLVAEMGMREDAARSITEWYCAATRISTEQPDARRQQNNNNAYLKLSWDSQRIQHTHRMKRR